MFGSGDDSEKKNNRDEEQNKLKGQVQQSRNHSNEIKADPLSTSIQDSRPLPKFWTRDVLIPTSILCGTVFLGAYVYKHFFRRIATSYDIPEGYFRKRSLLGKVTAVGDADNFRFYHTPGGILAGWGWLRRIPKSPRELANQTIPVRLYGIDAPECAHFGKPAQKYSDEALAWLRKYALSKRVRLTPLSRDQYGRIVGYSTVWKWNGIRDISVDMLNKGWAVVYEGKTGAEYHGIEPKLRKIEERARRKRIGMFKDGAPKLSPAEFKRKYK